MNIRFISLLILLAALGFSSFVSGDETGIDGLQSIDKDAMPSGASRFQLVFNGEIMGEMYYSAGFQGDQYVIFDGTTFYPDVRESAVVILDAATLLPKSVLIDGDFKRQIIDAELSWDSNSVSGEFEVKGPDELVRNVVEYQSELPAGTIIRESIFSLVPAIRLEVGAKYTLRWFNTLQRSVEDISLIVAGIESVTGPTGDHEVYKVEIRGGTPENIAYVTTAKPHTVVRIDVEGMPMHFERLPSEPAGSSSDAEP